MAAGFGRNAYTVPTCHDEVRRRGAHGLLPRYCCPRSARQKTWPPASASTSPDRVGPSHVWRTAEGRRSARRPMSHPRDHGATGPPVTHAGPHFRRAGGNARTRTVEGGAGRVREEVNHPTGDGTTGTKMPPAPLQAGCAMPTTRPTCLPLGLAVRDDTDVASRRSRQQVSRTVATSTLLSIVFLSSAQTPDRPGHSRTHSGDGPPRPGRQEWSGPGGVPVVGHTDITLERFSGARVGRRSHREMKRDVVTVART